MQSKSKNAAAASGSTLNNAAILLTLTLVTMLYAMTVTIANVSLPQIKGALSATTDEIALIITFNIIATACRYPYDWLAKYKVWERNTLSCGQ